MRGGKSRRCAGLVSQFCTLSVRDLWQLVLRREGPKFGLVGSISERGRMLSWNAHYLGSMYLELLNVVLVDD